MVTLLRYLSSGTERIDATELNDLVIELLEEGDDLMATIAEQWLKQGLEQGREEGHEAALMILRQYLQRRFGEEANRFETDLHQLDLPTLTALSDHAFASEQVANFETHLQAALTPRNAPGTADEPNQR